MNKNDKDSYQQIDYSIKIDSKKFPKLMQNTMQTLEEYDRNGDWIMYDGLALGLESFAKSVKNLKYKFEDVIKYWQEQRLESKEDYMNILENFSVLFAYNSGAIENNKITYYDTKEIFSRGKVINYTGDLKTLIEINNQKDCYNYILSKVVLKSPISEEWIKKVHKILIKGIYDNISEKYDYVPEINGVVPLIDNVQNKMRKLIEKINSTKLKDNEEIIKMAAYAHNVIEKIQPFTSGNGRIGRVLVNYFLMINDLPPIIIYNEDKKYYYLALEKFTTKEDISLTVEFLKYEMAKTWEKTLDRKYQVNKLRKKKLCDYLEN